MMGKSQPIKANDKKFLEGPLTVNNIAFDIFQGKLDLLVRTRPIFLKIQNGQHIFLLQ